MDNRIVTIGRQYGSGGREIGEKLAQRLGYAYYDTLILEEAPEKSGITPAVIKRYEGQLADKWLNPMISGGMSQDALLLQVKAALAQFEVIRQIGEKGAAVIVGCCADYVLREQENVPSVFVHVPQAQRAVRVAARNGISVKEAETRIRNTDKHRAAYYNCYAEKKWEATTTCQLYLDSGALGIQGAVDLLEFCVGQALNKWHRMKRKEIGKGQNMKMS